MGSKLLKEQSSGLYNIVHNPHAIVANVINQVLFNISFRRALIGDKLVVAWHK